MDSSNEDILIEQDLNEKYVDLITDKLKSVRKEIMNIRENRKLVYCKQFCLVRIRVLTIYLI